MTMKSRAHSMVQNSGSTVSEEGRGAVYIGTEQEQSKECRNVQDKGE